MKNKINLFFVILFLLFGISFVSAADPGHSSSVIGPGTFETGNYVFPNNLSASGLVGIGTSSPSAGLQVNSVSGNANVSIQTSHNGNSLYFITNAIVGGLNSLVRVKDSSIIFSNGTQGYGSLVIGPWSSSRSGIRVLANGSEIIGTFNVTSSSGGVGLYQDTSGNVGIGNSVPSYKLDVNGVINASGYLVNGSALATGSNVSGTYVPYTGATSNVALGNMNLSTAKISVSSGYNAIQDSSTSTRYLGFSGSGVHIGASSNELIWNGGSFYPANDAARNLGTSSNRWLNLSVSGYALVGNRLGIGTTMPNASIEIQTADATGNSTIFLTENTVHGGYMRYDGIGNVFSLGRLANGVQSDVISLPRDSGYVGIGTTTPQSNLEIYGTSNPRIRVNSSAATAPGFEIRQAGQTGWSIYQPGSSSDIRFATSGDLFSFTSTGRLGIGTTAPSTSLDVRGIGNFSGTIYINNNTDINSNLTSLWSAVNGVNSSSSGNASATYVPYVGANRSLNLGSFNFTTTGQVSTPVIKQTSGTYSGTNITDDDYSRTVYFNIPAGAYNPATYFKIASVKITGNYQNVRLNGYITTTSTSNHVGNERKTDFDFIAYAGTTPATPAVTYMKAGPGTDSIYVYSVPNGSGANTHNYDVYVKMAWWNDANGVLDIRTGYSSSVTVWQAGNDTGTTAPTDTLLTPNSNYNFVTTGNIGIGTETPSRTLDVRGIGNFSGTVYINNGTDLSAFVAGGTYNSTYHAYTVGQNLTLWSAINAKQTITNTTATYVPYTGANKNTALGVYNLTTTGRVGIGTTTPLHPLEVTVNTGTVPQNLTTLTHLSQGGDGGPVLNFRVEDGGTAVDGNGETLGRIAGFGSYAANAYVEGVRIDMKPEGAFNATSAPSYLSISTSASNSVTPTERFRITSTGNVGIGKTAPSTKLDVDGVVNASGYMINGSYIATGANVSDTYVPYTGASKNTNLGSWNLTTTGMVGIGTTTPSQKLEVLGQIRINGTAGAYDLRALSATQFGIISKVDQDTIFALATNWSSNRSGSASLFIYGEDNSSNWNRYLILAHNGSEGQVQTAGGGGGDIVLSPQLSEKVRITVGGNVGIGKTAPSTKLDIDGVVNASGYMVNGSYLATGSNVSGTYVPYTGATSNVALGVYNLTTTGRIGIGTTTPSYPLHVNSGSSNVELGRFQCAGGFCQIVVTNGSGTVDFGVAGNGGYLGTNSASDLNIRTGAATKLFIEHSTGEVGIGTTTPSRTLDVRGIGNFSGTIYINNNTDINSNLTSLWSALNGVNSSSSAADDWNISGNNLFPKSGNYNISIGSNYANAKLQVDAPTSVSFSPLAIFNDTTSDGSFIFMDGTSNSNSFLPTILSRGNRSGAESYGVRWIAEPGEDRVDAAAFQIVGRTRAEGVLSNSPLFQVSDYSQTLASSSAASRFTVASSGSTYINSSAFQALTLQRTGTTTGGVAVSTRNGAGWQWDAGTMSSGEYFVMDRTSFSGNGVSRLIISNGTANPLTTINSSLRLNGIGNFSGTIYINNGTDISSAFNNASYLSTYNSTYHAYTVGQNLTLWSAINAKQTTANTTASYVPYTGANKNVNLGNNNLQIGAYSNAGGLIIQQGVYPYNGFFNYTDDGSGYGPAFLHRNSNTGNTTPVFWLQTAGDNIKAIVSGDLQLGTTNSSNYGAGIYPSTTVRTYIAGLPNTNSYINNGGNFGIGKTSPSTKLDVDGVVNASGFMVNGSYIATGANVSGTYVPYTGASSNVNLGNFNITTKRLTLTSSVIDSNTQVMEIGHSQNIFLNADQDGVPATGSVILGAAGNYYLVVNGTTGNVGVGDTLLSPSHTLEVQGTFNVSNTNGGARLASTGDFVIGI